MLDNRDSRLVHELIEICHDGQQFYQHAATEVTDCELKSLFREMANIRTGIVHDLSRQAGVIGGSPDTGGSLVDQMRTVYDDVKSHISDDYHYQCVSALEASEEVALKTFRDDIRKIDSPYIAGHMAEHLATLQVTHDKMKDIKGSLLIAVRH